MYRTNILSFKLIIAIVIIILTQPTGFSQFCLTVDTSSTPTIVPPSNSPESVEMQDVKVRISVWILRKTNGSGARNMIEVQQTMCQLNEYFSPGGIIFQYDVKFFDDQYAFAGCGASGYVLGDPTPYINLRAHAISTQHFDNNAINLYITPPFNQDITDGFFSPYAGAISVAATGVQSTVPTKFAAIGEFDGALTTKNIDIEAAPHEIGHCLGLYHPFRQYCEAPLSCSELVDGSNCSICGDLVCDTPPHYG